MIKLKNILLTIFLLMVLSPLALAGIKGSEHDFSTEGWNTSGEICKVCHTPHNGDSSFDYGPLWNHESTTATYTLYSSPTLDATVEQPGGVSKLCLSCHDGTVAIDSFDGNSGSNYMTGPPAVGRNNDLSDDHPVGFEWKHQSIVDNCTAVCHFVHGDPYSYPVRFYDCGKENACMECSTCHDPHNNQDNNRMLRLTLEGSQLCLLCHQK